MCIRVRTNIVNYYNYHCIVPTTVYIECTGATSLGPTPRLVAIYMYIHIANQSLQFYSPIKDIPLYILYTKNSSYMYMYIHVYSLLLGCCYVYCTKINKPYSKGNVRVTISSVKV